MTHSTPRQLASKQIENDRERTRRFPELLQRKLMKMSGSPFAFLRGASPLFYELLRSDPDLAGGSAGDGWIVGDAHLENFGAYSPARSDIRSEKRAAVFNLNDFDGAVLGPWRWDVLRLMTSLVLAGRELGVTGPVALDLSMQLLATYVDSVFASRPVPTPPEPVVALVERMGSRSRRELLDARTLSDGVRREFIRGERYRDLPGGIIEQIPQALESYVAGLMPLERPLLEQLEIVDAAHRVAGTGSLGGLRIAVLTRGKGGPDGGWIFDMKEATETSATELLGPSTVSPAERTVTAFRTCVEAPPRMLGATRIGSMGMVVRRLTPQEDKLSLRSLRPDALRPLAAYLGALLGAAHVRGRTTPSPVPWSQREQSEMLERAVAIAALHEAIYLEWCLLLRGGAPDRPSTT